MGTTKKLLILSPPFGSPGGVSSYVLSLKGNWSVKEKYFFRGNTGVGSFTRVLQMVREYSSFFSTCLRSRPYKTVMVNTSMGRKALTRDTVFIWIAILLGKKVVVFIHGWDDAFFASCSRWRLSGLFRASKIFVLSHDFKKGLHKKGCKKDVLVETTVVAKDFIRCFDQVNLVEKTPTNLLYLARLEPEKGIMTLLKSFRDLSVRYPTIHLNIAGFGSLEEEVKAFIADEGISNITYHGLVRGQAKATLFKQACIYILPTSHGEGLPISVLEAMAAGLVVVTSAAGALSGFFRDGKMGFKLKDVSQEQVTVKIEEAIKNKNKVAGISQYNFAYARDHFTVEKAIGRLEKEIWKDS